MRWLAGAFASGRVIDAILALTAAEAVALVAYRRATGRGVRPDDFLINLLSGVFMLLALRCALTGAGWVWVGAWLFASLLAHLADLFHRWRT